MILPNLPRFSSKRLSINYDHPCSLCGIKTRVDDSRCKDCQKQFFRTKFSWDMIAAATREEKDEAIREIDELIQEIVEEQDVTEEDQRYLAGYNDGQEGIEPVDPEDELYWLGYLDGKGDKTNLTLPPVAEKAYPDDIKEIHKEVNDIFEKSPTHFCPNCNWQAASKRELDWHIVARNCSSNDGR